MAKTEFGKLEDLTPDTRNANRGTARGLAMVESSLRKYGAGRSILVDKKGRIVAGNKTAQAATDAGLSKTIVVQTTGNEVVVVQRMDLDLDKDKAARELAVADNRAGEVGLEWDGKEIAQLQLEEIDLSQMFTPAELDAIADKEVSLNSSDVEKAIQNARIKVKIITFSPDDWVSWKNQIVNFLNEKNINYEIDE